SRKIIIVSAPGKRSSDDTKTTDLLIALSKSVEGNSYDEEALARVVNRYAEIVRDLSLSESLIDSIEDNLKQTISKLHNNEKRLLDALKASGENNNAKLLAAYLQSSVHEAYYVSIKVDGLIVIVDRDMSLVLLI